VLVVAIVLLYPGHVFQDRIFFAGDNQAAFSFSTVAEEPMEEGIYPVWNPYLFAGMPSFGSLSFTPYVYPPNAFLKLLVKYLFFPKYLWLFFHTFLAGFGTYLLLRDRKASFMPALTAGVLMMWMPNLVAVGANGHGSQACAVGYIPFALLFWDRMWRGKGILVNGAALVIVLGFSMLRGHLQISYYTYALIAMHLLFFGVARLVDGINGKIPEASVLPRWILSKLTGGGRRYSTGPAVLELAWSAMLLVVVVGGSLLISAVLYLPTHDYAQYSIRGATTAGGVDYSYATSWSLHPLESLTFLFPYSFGFGKDLYFGHMPFTDYPNYVGFVVLACALAAMIMARTRFVWFLFFVVVISTLVSFGKFFPILYDPLFKWAPYFNKFRVPVMVLIVQQFALVVMAGFGLDALLRASPEKGKRNAVTGLAVAFLIFMIVILSHGFWPGEFANAISGNIRGARNPQEQLLVARVVGNYLFKDLVRFSIMLAAMFVLMFVYYKRKFPGRLFCVLLLGLAMIDFYLVDRNILHPEIFRKHEQLRIIQDRSVMDQYREPDGVINFLKREKRPFRIFPMDNPQRPFSRMFQSNRFMVFGISSIGGYHPAKLAIYEKFFAAFHRGLSSGHLQLLDMMNVRYLVTGAELQDHPRFRAVWSGQNDLGEPRFIYENLGALPRAWMVESYRVADDKTALDLLAAGKVDVAKEVILEKEPAVIPSNAGGDSVTTVEIEKLGFNEIRVKTKADSPSILVLSEVYYPDWRVEVDGKPAELLRANFILRAVALEGGEHDVVFRYDTSLLKKGAYISGTSLGVFVLVLIVGLVFTLRGRRVGSTDRHPDV
jgi:NADH:ubiquinone oxidoreductase subunit 6 (subunit J)